MRRAELVALLSRPVLEVAPALLGMRLRTRLGGEVTEVALIEVEAYDGPNDPASHAYRGPTRRNRSMFGEAGTIYVYRSYGIHWCMNIVVGEGGHPSAVLLRGGMPTAGRAVMEYRRGRPDHLADGPGKLCQALAVTGAQDGTSVLSGAVRLLIGVPPDQIRTAPRIGLTKAADREWRFSAA